MMFANALGVRAIRVYAKSKETLDVYNIPQPVQKYSLHNIIKKKILNEEYVKSNVISS